MFGWFKKKPAAPAAPTRQVSVTFVDDGRTVEVRAGSALGEVCDEEGLSLAFGCREGGCGTCLIEIVSGAEQLNPRSDTEQEMLDMMAEGNPRARLACQCIVRGPVTFRSLES